MPASSQSHGNTNNIMITSHELAASQATRQLLEITLSEHGFKWVHRNATDLCPNDHMRVQLVRKGTGDLLAEVTYTKRLKRNLLGQLTGSVFSRSVARVSRVLVPRDLKRCMPFVFVSKRVQHYDWEGREVA